MAKAKEEKKDTEEQKVDKNLQKIEELEKKIAADMHTMLGIKAKVTLVAPKSITRSEGKAVRVIDNRKI